MKWTERELKKIAPYRHYNTPSNRRASQPLTIFGPREDSNEVLAWVPTTLESNIVFSIAPTSGLAETTSTSICHGELDKFTTPK